MTKWVKRSSPGAIDMLQDCFDITDWDVFKPEHQDDIDTFTDYVMSYICFCESVCIPTKSVTIYSNTKPWFKWIKWILIPENWSTSHEITLMFNMQLLHNVMIEMLKMWLLYTVMIKMSKL